MLGPEYLPTRPRSVNSGYREATELDFARLRPLQGYGRFEYLRRRWGI